MDKKGKTVTESKIDRLLSIKEAAAILGISTWTLYHWCLMGRFPSIKLGRLRKISQDDLRSYIEKSRM